MTLVWKVYVIDATTGTERFQDMTEIGAVDMQKSSFQPTTSPRSSSSKLVLSFPIATPDLHITELMEVWAGWRDDATNDWAENPPPFGGYITRIDRETVYGGEKIFECTLSDYNILLKRTDVKGWPLFVRYLPYPNANVGYPAGYTVQDWLIGSQSGGQPYDGVVRAHLGNGVRYDGVDPIFDTIVFDVDTLPGILYVVPGTGAIQGYFGGGNTTVDSVVKALADQTMITYLANYVGPDLTVGYWMSAAPRGDAIVPKFNFKNVEDNVSFADFVVAADANEAIGEIPMLHPHRHERDATDVRTVINLFGLGGDETEPGTPLTFASYIHPTHSLIYPTKYQVEPGWGGGPIFEPRLHKTTTAQKLAEVIENRVWGAKGSIEFFVPVQIMAGQRVRVRDPNEAIDRIYVVVESEGPDENGHWRVRVGFTQPTISDVLGGGMSDVLLVREDLSWKNGTLSGGSRLLPGQGERTPPDLQPTNPRQNHITAGYTDTAALKIQGTLRTRPSATDDPPVTVNPFEILPASTNLDQYPKPGTWASHDDGRPHPNAIHLGGFTENGDYPGTFAVYRLIITAIDVEGGPGSVTIKKNGTAVAGPFTVGHHAILDPLIFEPRVLTSPADIMTLTWTGTSTVPTYVVAWEA